MSSATTSAPTIPRGELQGEHHHHFADGIIKMPLTTFGNVKADVLALKDMSYARQNFCSIILNSAWPS